MRHLTVCILVTLTVLLGSAGESFALPECKGSPTDDRSVLGQWHNCEGIILRSEGIRFEGEFKDGELHGQGTLTFSAPHKGAGQKFFGEYSGGKLHGQVTHTFSAPHKSAGQKYVGEYKDSKKNGQGTLTFSAPHKFVGSKYVGEFKDDKRHGQGTHTYTSGSKYVGEWKDSKTLSSTWRRGWRFPGDYKWSFLGIF